VKVIVTGSRDWTGVYATQRIHTVLEVVLALCEVLGTKLTLVHGDCPTGADRTVDDWARRRDDIGVSVTTFPADWRTLGKAAGPIRNQAMVDSGADMCIGFLKGGSRGTSITLAMARAAGIPTYTVHWEEDIE
jgi:hypothetical protein